MCPICALASSAKGKSKEGQTQPGKSRLPHPERLHARLGACCKLPWQPQFWAFLIWILVSLFFSLSQCSKGWLLLAPEASIPRKGSWGGHCWFRKLSFTDPEKGRVSGWSRLLSSFPGLPLSPPLPTLATRKQG